MFDNVFIDEYTDDFITFAARAATVGMNGEIFRDIEKLAMDGQKNAIQVWYLYANPEKIKALENGSAAENNESDPYVAIEKRIKPLTKKEGLEKLALSPNDCLAIANRYYCLGKMDLFEDFYLKALADYKSQIQETQSIVMMERYYELSSSFYGDKYVKAHTTEIKKLNKALRKSVKAGNTTPQYLYALANNISEFNNGKAAEAMEIYDILASRQLSSDEKLSNDDKAK